MQLAFGQKLIFFFVTCFGSVRDGSKKTNFSLSCLVPARCSMILDGNSKGFQARQSQLTAAPCAGRSSLPLGLQLHQVTYILQYIASNKSHVSTHLTIQMFEPSYSSNFVRLQTGSLNMIAGYFLPVRFSPRLGEGGNSKGKYMPSRPAGCLLVSGSNSSCIAPCICTLQTTEYSSKGMSMGGNYLESKALSCLLLAYGVDLLAWPFLDSGGILTNETSTYFRLAHSGKSFNDLGRISDERQDPSSCILPRLGLLA